MTREQKITKEEFDSIKQGRQLFYFDTTREIIEGEDLLLQEWIDGVFAGNTIHATAGRVQSVSEGTIVSLKINRSTQTSDKKRLYRDTHTKIISGVLSGLAEYLDLDRSLVRFAFVLLTVITGVIPCCIAYVIATLIVPKQ